MRAYFGGNHGSRQNDGAPDNRPRVFQPPPPPIPSIPVHRSYILILFSPSTSDSHRQSQARLQRSALNCKGERNVPSAKWFTWLESRARPKPLVNWHSTGQGAVIPYRLNCFLFDTTRKGNSLKALSADGNDPNWFLLNWTKYIILTDFTKVTLQSRSTTSHNIYVVLRCVGERNLSCVLHNVIMYLLHSNAYLVGLAQTGLCWGEMGGGGIQVGL